MAEFDDLNELVRAVRATVDAGYVGVDAFTPFPVEAVSEALGEHHNRLPLLVLIGGVCGGIAGYLLQYWTSVVDYPLNVGGRPFHSWPSFVPVTFECTILGAALAVVLGMLALNGLPMPYHPVFNVPRFALSSRDRFFLCIKANDPLFDRENTRRFLERFVPRQVSEVDL
jgi:hypothetical protein